MKCINKIIGKLQLLFSLGLYFAILHAEVVINEFFILTDENSHVPQYIELYNNDTISVNLLDWSISTLLGNQVFEPINIFNSSTNGSVNNLEISPHGYFLIETTFPSSSFFNHGLYNDTDNIEAMQGDIDLNFMWLPTYGEGTIILSNNNTTIDSVTYDFDDEGWHPLLGEESRGHSLRLHRPDLDNSLPKNWSLSPDTENSIWLYDDDGERCSSLMLAL